MAIDATLLSADATKGVTTDGVATKPGASDCNSYATFKTSYGYDPVRWTRHHKMNLRIKYLDIDKTNKEIKSTREWEINPYTPF